MNICVCDVCVCDVCVCDVCMCVYDVCVYVIDQPALDAYNHVRAKRLKKSAQSFTICDVCVEDVRVRICVCVCVCVCVVNICAT